MITFVTLFLGLFLGVQPVEVQVGAEVAAVELVLDGEPVDRLEGPVWRGRVDFGTDLTPHHLEAVALDERGRELDRAERWINLPRPPAEVNLFLETTEDDRRIVRIYWESVVGTRPLAVRLELDGEPLPEADLSGVELPELDPDTAHFLRAELDFPDNISTSTEIAFGGGFREAVDARLTAVPLELAKDREVAAESLEGVLAEEGEPLPVVAVEEGAVDLVLVPDAGALSVLTEMSLEWQTHASVRNQYRTAQENPLAELRRTLPLPKDQRLRFLWPFAQVRLRQGGIPSNLFVSSPELTHADGGLVWLLSRVQPPPGLQPRTSLSTAVAVAGTVAAGRNRRRAVVLLWTGGEGDRSHLSAVTVRRYLERLRVPFQVWSLVEDRPAPGWGEPIEASSLLELERAYKQLNRALERQRIVWVPGTHLPQKIELISSDGKLRLARTPVPADEPMVPPSAALPGSVQAPELERIEALPEAGDPESGEGGVERPKANAALEDSLQALAPGAESEVRGPSLYDVGRLPASVVLDEGVRLRAAPEPEASRLAVVDASVELPVVARRGDWVRVTYQGRSGWVRPTPEGRVRAAEESALPVPEPVTVEPSPADRRQRRRARAEALLGSDPRTLGPYELLTDVEDAELLAGLERLTGALPEVFGRRYGLAPSPPGPDEAVLLFAQESSYLRFTEEDARQVAAPDLAALGLAAHAGGGLAALYVGEQSWGQVAALLTHELTHLITNRDLGEELPPWLDEGLAEDLAYCRIEEDGTLVAGTLGGVASRSERRIRLAPGVQRIEQKQEITGARAALVRLARLADTGGVPSLEALTRLSREEFVAPEGRDLRYPLSAFFVRFLLDRGETAGAFRGYLAGIAAGAPADSDGLVEHLGTDWDRLQRRFESWLRAEVRRLGPG